MGLLKKGFILSLLMLNLILQSNAMKIGAMKIGWKVGYSWIKTSYISNIASTQLTFGLMGIFQSPIDNISSRIEFNYVGPGEHDDIGSMDYLETTFLLGYLINTAEDKVLVEKDIPTGGIQFYAGPSLIMRNGSKVFKKSVEMAYNLGMIWKMGRAGLDFRINQTIGENTYEVYEENLNFTTLSISAGYFVK